MKNGLQLKMNIFCDKNGEETRIMRRRTEYFGDIMNAGAQVDGVMPENSLSLFAYQVVA